MHGIRISALESILTAWQSLLLTVLCTVIAPDQAALETEARISPLLSEKRKLFNDLLTAKGT